MSKRLDNVGMSPETAIAGDQDPNSFGTPLDDETLRDFAHHLGQVARFERIEGQHPEHSEQALAATRTQQIRDWLLQEMMRRGIADDNAQAPLQGVKSLPLT